jgi:hypothetical protein
MPRFYTDFRQERFDTQGLAGNVYHCPGGDTTVSGGGVAGMGSSTRST